jgi:hypothetical protein
MPVPDAGMPALKKTDPQPKKKEEPEVPSIIAATKLRHVAQPLGKSPEDPELSSGKLLTAGVVLKSVPQSDRGVTSPAEKGKFQMPSLRKVGPKSPSPDPISAPPPISSPLPPADNFGPGSPTDFLQDPPPPPPADGGDEPGPPPPSPPPPLDGSPRGGADLPPPAQAEGSKAPSDRRGSAMPAPDMVAVPQGSESASDDGASVSSSGSGAILDRAKFSRHKNKGKIPSKNKLPVSALIEEDRSPRKKKEVRAHWRRVGVCVTCVAAQGDSGFIEFEGKFDGFEEDQFEPMLVRVKDSVLYIRAEADVEDEDISFDLTDESTVVSQDASDLLSLNLVHEDKKILFKVRLLISIEFALLCL